MRNVLETDTVRGDGGSKLGTNCSKEKGLGNHLEVEINVWQLGSNWIGEWFIQQLFLIPVLCQILHGVL